MDHAHVIRHKHFDEGHGIRRIARKMGLHRLTVREYLDAAKPVAEGVNSSTEMGHGRDWPSYR